MHEKDKEDVIRFGQNVHTTQTFSKKETLKRPFSSLEGSITKLLTTKLSCQKIACAELRVTSILPRFFGQLQRVLGEPLAKA